MSELRVQSIDAKHIRVSGIEPFLTYCLQGLGEVLEQRDLPSVRGRLFPNPTAADQRLNNDWEKSVTPELRHIFVTAGETVFRDLTGLKEDAQVPPQYEVTFPAEHINAWMSALNEARLILGERFHITEGDMDKISLEAPDEKTLAIVKVEMLGALLYLFVELAMGDSEVDRDGPKDPV